MLAMQCLQGNKQCGCRQVGAGAQRNSVATAGKQYLGICDNDLALDKLWK